MITIRPSSVADTRSCDYTKVTRQQLLEASHQHIGDVRQALRYFQGLLANAALNHDADKITDIDTFHRDFLTGFQQTEWWDRHRQINRHHLTAADGVREDVDLIDVLDYVADCVMAAMGRKGELTFPIELPPELLVRALANTVQKLRAEVVVDAG